MILIRVAELCRGIAALLTPTELRVDFDWF